jgi:uncharacterized Zn-binding protein involved in type VI secretion
METQTIAERVAHNEDAFRKANERIEEAADDMAGHMQSMPFICECPDRSCTAIIPLKRHEYETVRRRGNTFLVAPGHEVVVVEGIQIARVGQTFDHFSLMVKVGEAGRTAEELDPRAGDS